VPDVLELPTGSGADGGTGKSAAPLLSFDRFFSGTGSPPRSRGDTPPSSPAGWSETAVPTPPSLSPTFGGMPVIPPPPPNVTPSTWASFDQFVTPTSSAAEPSGVSVPTPPAVPLSPRPTPSTQGSALPPAADPYADAWARTPAQQTTPVPPPALVPAVLRTPVVKQPPVSDFRIEPPVAPEAAPTPAPEPPPARPASDFHRWLEGLS
jgi:hypothetical protein